MQIWQDTSYDPMPNNLHLFLGETTHTNLCHDVFIVSHKLDSITTQMQGVHTINHNAL